MAARAFGAAAGISLLPGLDHLRAVALTYEQGLLPVWRSDRGDDPAVLPGVPRFAQFKRARLLERFGSDKPMPTMAVSQFEIR